MANRSPLLIIILLFPFFIQAQREESDFKSFWDKGYHLQSKDGHFKMKFGGRIQQDWAFFSQDKALDDLFFPVHDQSEFRRLRLYNSGTIYQSVQYKFQVNFGDGKVTLSDVYINLKGLPLVGNLKIGHFKEPFSLDMMSSSNDVTFMEPALPTAFKKQRNTGLQFSNGILDGKATWALGVFKNTDKFGKTIEGKGGYNLTGRITAVPFWNEARHQLLHLGVAFSRRTPSINDFFIKSKPESHLALPYVNTGSIPDVSSELSFGTELAFVSNSLSFQAEYIGLAVNTQLGDYVFSGYYVETAFFLTGEHKKYAAKSGYFKRVNPKNNFGTGGLGAFELALRYSHLDLTDQSITGGIMNDITFGLNWYLNPATRFSLNYIQANVAKTGKNHILQTRFQLAF